MTTPQAPSVPPAHKDWAKWLRSRLAGKVTVFRCFDATESASIDVLLAEDGDDAFAATIGLMDGRYGGSGRADRRTEILVDRHGHDEQVGNFAATIAFYIMNGRVSAQTGVVLRDVMTLYWPDTALPHIYLATPFQHPDLAMVTLPDRTLHPLLAVPVSDAEAAVAVGTRGLSLETLWRSQGTDVLDWARTSAA
jgi:hypothetical protein